MRRLIIDGMNVIGSRPDGWWRDRDGAVRRLVADLDQPANVLDAQITVVFDGRPLPDLPEGMYGQVTVRYATRRGPGAADDDIVQLVEADPDPAGLEVVTADARLRARVTALGAIVSGPRALLDHISPQM